MVLVLWQVPTGSVRIYKDGMLIDTVNLVAVVDSFIIEINGVDTGSTDGHNVLEVERGRIRMLFADCPDGTCIRQGWTSGGVMPIVCLPNRVIVVFDGGYGVDAVVG